MKNILGYIFRTISTKTELDYYLEEDNLFVTQEFDIISWWKTNKLKFLTLETIAKDVLAIPIKVVTIKSTSSYYYGGFDVYKKLDMKLKPSR